MAQTEAGQNAARRKLANSEMGSRNKNAQAIGKVSAYENPNQQVGATKQNTPALRKKLIKTNTGV